MNKTIIASNIAGDIYTFYNKYEKYKHKFENQEISASKFANTQYVMIPKLYYLSEVINKLKELGYKFANYEKEVCILNDLIASVKLTLDNSQLTELSAIEQFSLATYLTKYKKVVPVLDEDLNTEI